MSRNISIKLIAIFAAVIAAALLIFSLVMCSVISKYSVNANTNKKADIADAVAEEISLYSLMTNDFDFEDTLGWYGGHFAETLGRMAQRCKGDIYLVDFKGMIVSSSSESDIGRQMMNEAEFSSLFQSNVTSDAGTVYGFFSSSKSNYYLPIMMNTSVKGMVIVSTPDAADHALTDRMFASIAALALWLLLVSFILSYIAVTRYTAPLKEISRVAKECEKGNFDERITVSGNDEISDLANAINGMLETLSVNDKQRRNFIASVSHDLRTPMTTISGFVDGILDGTIPPEKKDDYLEIISVETKRLTRLVNTLLSVASTSLSSAKPVMVPFNLSEKARQILISFEKKIDQKKMDVEFIGEEDVYAFAEPDSIHQVIYNLCDNAVKFTNEGGKLTLAIEEKDGKASVRIRNTGEGISAEELPHIFESFYKTDSSRGKDKHGVGLGLYIVKTVLNNHGETVSCKSVPGEYTEFSFSLKLAEKTAAKK